MYLMKLPAENVNIQKHTMKLTLEQEKTGCAVLDVGIKVPMN